MRNTLFDEVPDGWHNATLGELCLAGGGGLQTGPFGSQLHAADYTPTGVPSVMPQNIGDNVIIETGIARITQHDADRLSKYLLREGDIVYSRRGDVGRRAFVRAGEDGWLCGTGCLRVRLGDSADPKFVSYYLGHPEVREWVVRHAVGATMPNLNTTILAGVPMVVPPLRTQHAIAAVLGVLDDKIAVNERISTTYERILRIRFDELGVDSDPASGTGAAVADFVDLNPSTPAPALDEAAYLEMAVLPTQSARVRSWSRRLPRSGTRFRNGDTVMARITPCLENGKVAFVDFMEDGEVGVGSTEFIVFRARPGVPVHLPYFLARSPRFRSHAVQNMSGSSGRQRVGAAALAPFPLNQPEPEALEGFGEVAAATFAHMKSLDAESTYLTDLRDTLLPGLMSGEIRVREAERVVEEAT